MANDTLLGRIPLAETNVHRIRAEATEATNAATDYEVELRTFFNLSGAQVPEFDLILLGLGPEGHTASLFPGARALAETHRLVVADWIAKLGTDRITLTPSVLNNARCVMFLVSGAEKAAALKAILEGPYQPEQLPAQLVNATHGRLIWLLDHAAAAGLGSPAILRERTTSKLKPSRVPLRWFDKGISFSLDLAADVTSIQVITDQPHRLHERVHRCWTDK